MGASTNDQAAGKSAALPTPARKVVEAGRERGVEVVPQAFPAGTRTAQDAAKAIGCELGQIAKSLVFFADDEPIVVLMAGDRRVDTRLLREVLGVADARKADADEVREATGFAIGGTPPFGHVQTLRVILDSSLSRFTDLWAAAGTPQHVFPITLSDLKKAAAAETAKVAEATSS